MCVGVVEPIINNDSKVKYIECTILNSQENYLPITVEWGNCT